MKYEVTIEVAFDCQCPGDNHPAGCDMFDEWMKKEATFDVTMNSTGNYGPSGHSEWIVSSQSLGNLYNFMMSYCSNDQSLVFDELSTSLIVTDDRPKDPGPPPTTENTLRRMQESCKSLKGDVNELRVMGDMRESYIGLLDEDVDNLTQTVQIFLEDPTINSSTN